MKKKDEKWFRTIFLLFLILLLALGIRVYQLNLIPVFADEAIYIRWAQVMRAEPGLRFLPLSDGKQPLFMWSVIPFLKFISDPLVAGRVVSILTGASTLVGVFILTYIFFKSKKASLLAALLYALSPFAIFFDRMALVDSMLSMFGIWTVIFMNLAVRNLRLDFALLAGFSLGGAMLTKSPSIFFVLLLPSILVFTPLEEKPLKQSFLKALALTAITLSLGYAIYNILRLGPNFHLIGSRNYDYVYPYSHVFENALNPFVGHIEKIFRWFMQIGPAAIVFMAIAGLFGNFRKLKKETIILIVWAIMPILVQAQFAKVLTTRYVFFTLPFVIVLAASLVLKLKSTFYRYAAYGLITLFIGHALVFFVPFFQNPAKANWPEKEGYLANWTAGTGIKEVSEIIKQKRNENTGKQIVVGTEGYFGTLPDGLQMYLEKEQGIVVIGVGLGISQIPSELVNAKNSGNIVYLAANESRLNFPKSFEESGLSIISEFKKAPRDPGSHNYVQYGSQDTFYLLEVL